MRRSGIASRSTLAASLAELALLVHIGILREFADDLHRIILR